MNLKQVECFCCLAETLNFTKAAEMTYMSQSAFSRSIAALEAELDCLLIQRSKISPRLTEAGVKVYEKSKIIVEQMSEIKEIAYRNRMGTLNNFKIGVPWGGLFPIHKRILRGYRHQYPEVVIDVNEYSEADLIKELELGNIELAFFIMHDNRGLEQFNIKKLDKMKIGFICSNDHPLAGRESVSMEELRQESFIFMKSDKGPMVNRFIMELCVRHGFQPDIVHYADSPFILLDMVEEELGVTIMSELVVMLGNKSVAFIPIEDVPYARPCLLWKKNNTNKELKRLTDYFCEQLGIR